MIQLVDDWPDPLLRQVRMKGFLPRRRIYLSQTSGWRFFLKPIFRQFLGGFMPSQMYVSWDLARCTCNCFFYLTGLACCLLNIYVLTQNDFYGQVHYIDMHLYWDVLLSCIYLSLQVKIQCL